MISEWKEMNRKTGGREENTNVPPNQKITAGEFNIGESNLENLHKYTEDDNNKIAQIVSDIQKYNDQIKQEWKNNYFSHEPKDQYDFPDDGKGMWFPDIITKITDKSVNWPIESSNFWGGKLRRKNNVPDTHISVPLYSDFAINSPIFLRQSLGDNCYFYPPKDRRIEIFENNSGKGLSIFYYWDYLINFLTLGEVKIAANIVKKILIGLQTFFKPSNSSFPYNKYLGFIVNSSYTWTTNNIKNLILYDNPISNSFGFFSDDGLPNGQVEIKWKSIENINSAQMNSTDFYIGKYEVATPPELATTNIEVEVVTFGIIKILNYEYLIDTNYEIVCESSNTSISTCEISPIYKGLMVYGFKIGTTTLNVYSVKNPDKIRSKEQTINVKVIETKPLQV